MVLKEDNLVLNSHFSALSFRLLSVEDAKRRQMWFVVYADRHKLRIGGEDQAVSGHSAMHVAFFTQNSSGISVTLTLE